jgi:hypothetical protein
MKFTFSQNSNNDPEEIDPETNEHLDQLTEGIMGEDPKPLYVPGLIGDDWQNLPKDAIIEFLKAKQADGYSDRAIKWASQILINQFAGLPASTQQTIHLNPGDWLAHNVTSVMYWIDGANIPLSHPALKDLSKAGREATKFIDLEGQKDLAKTSPVSEANIVYKFSDGWIVAEVSQNQIDHENQLTSITKEFYFQGPGDAIYAFKDKDGVTHSMVATHDDITSETFDVWEADWDQEGPEHIKEWFKHLKTNGQIITSSIDNTDSEPKNARELGDYMMDDIGLPINYSSWGGLPVDYEKQILTAMSDYDAYTYGARGRAREAADAIIGYAIQRNQLKELEDGRQEAESKLYEDFSMDDDERGMTNQRPDEDDFDMDNPSSAKAYHDALEAYDNERGEIQTRSGWFQFIQYMYEEVERATANAIKNEKARKKAWKANMKRLSAQEAARKEQEQAESIATGIFQENSTKGWYRSSKTASNGISAREWSEMIAKAKQ